MRSWLKGILLGAAYGAGFLLLRQVSASQWYLPSGLRFAMLLLTPYRMWPYLIAGEWCALLPLRYGYLEESGFPWSWLFLTVFPTAPAVALVVRVLREKWRSTKIKTSRDMAYFLVGIAAAALVSSGLATLALSRIGAFHEVTGGPAWRSEYLYLTGDLLGMLMVAPLGMMLWRRPQKFGDHAKSWWASVLILLGSSAVLALLSQASADPDIRRVAYTLMLVPVVWLTYRHGWPGAAIGAVISNFFTSLTIPIFHNAHVSKFDVLDIQQFLIFGLMSTLFLGALISELRRRDHLMSQVVRKAVRLAKQNARVNELQLSRQAALAKEAYVEMQKSGAAILRQVRRIKRPDLAMTLNREVIEPVRAEARKLINSLYPQLLDTHGLSVALQHGLIVDNLDSLGLIYDVEIRGDTRLLSRELQITLYRIAYDAVLLVAPDTRLGSVFLRLRVGKRRDGRAWAALRVQGEPNRRGVSLWHQARRASNTPISAVLTATDIETRVMTYGGRMHHSEKDAVKRLAVLLLDEPGLELIPEAYPVPHSSTAN
jgi:glucose-6-phosphate-specific signal transduction histidine kinase